MRVLVLGGAGPMGAGTVRDLLSARSAGVEAVVVADGFEDRLAALAAAPEEVFDPETFFAELRKRHFVVETETHAPRP